MDTSISLPPPDSSGAAYTDLVTLKPLMPGDKPPPVKDGVNILFKDDVDSLQEVNDITDSMSINLQLGGSVKTAEAQMQHELDTLDPSNPKVPILKKYIEICDILLKGGSIPGLEMSITLNKDGTVAYTTLDADNVSDSTIKKAEAHIKASQVKTNKWLVGNSYVAFVVEFMILMRMLMANKALEGRLETLCMTLMKEMAKSVAHMITDAGKKTRAMHMIAGAVAVTQAASSGVSTLVSGIGMAKSMAKPPIDTPTTLSTSKPTDLRIKGDPANPPGPDVRVPSHVKVMQSDGRTWKTFDNTNNLTPPDAPAPGPGGKIPPGTVAPSAGPKAAPGAEIRYKKDAAGHEVMVPKYQEHPTREIDGRLQYTKTKTEIERENTVNHSKFMMYQTLPKGVADTISQAMQAWKEFASADLEFQKAIDDAAKEIFSMLQRLQERAMNSAAEALKQNSDLVDQTINQLNAIRQKLIEAFTAALRRSKS